MAKFSARLAGKTHACPVQANLAKDVYEVLASFSTWGYPLPFITLTARTLLLRLTAGLSRPTFGVVQARDGG
jgi:hypothetical protein